MIKAKDDLEGMTLGALIGYADSIGCRADWSNDTVTETVVTDAILGQLERLAVLEGKGVYLSGRIAGNDNAHRIFAKAERCACMVGARYVFNPLSDAVQVTRPGWSREQHMRADIHMLTGGSIDMVLLLPGWTESAGAKAEVLVANHCGIGKLIWKGTR